MPRVSVVMSVYNGDTYVRQAIDSILGQSMMNYEFIIVNDGSTDKTHEILQGYSDSRIRVVDQDNRGLTKALNRAIALSKAEYIARIDADDMALPERLDRQVSFLDENPAVGVVGTAYYEMNAQGQIIGTRVFPTEDLHLRRHLIKYNPFFHGSAMIRRAAFDRAGLYDETFPRAQDYELWLRVARAFRLANLSECLAVRRYDGRNITIVNETEQIRCALRARLNAIRSGQYPWWCVRYMIRPYCVAILPMVLRNLIRHHFLRSGRIL